MRINISLKIVGIVFFVIILFIGSAVLIGTEFVRQRTEKFYVEKAEAITRSLGTGIQSIKDIENKETLLRIMNKQIWLSPDILDIHFIKKQDDEFIIFVGSDSLHEDQAADIDNRNSFEQNSIIHKFISEKSYRRLRVITPVQVSGQTVGTFQVDFTLESLDTDIKNMNITILLGGLLVMIIVTLVLFIFLSIFVIKPIDKLREGVLSLSKGDYNYKVNINSNDELGVLAHSFNEMASQLKDQNKKILQDEKDLQNQVDHRTKELQNKLTELENTEQAVLNILEDTDATNKDLIVVREELRKNIKELQNMDKKKDEFVSVTAHELKTPLTSIRGFSELLTGKNVIKDKKKMQAYIEIIISDTKRLEKLVTDILDLSRLDLDTMKFDLQPTTVDNVIQELKNLVDLAIKKKGVKSIYKIGKNIPEINTDISRLTQVLSNLVNNAIKYTEKGYIKVEAEKKGMFVLFRVTDTGTGIPKREHKKIFDRFYQVDSSYTRKVGGSGLGLAICKGIVQKLGGQIAVVKSTMGKGTVIELTIKINPIMQT